MIEIASDRERALARQIVRDLLTAGLAEDVLAWARALQDMLAAGGPVTFLVCAGLADTALATMGPHSGDVVLLSPDGDLDSLAAGNPAAAGQILAARFIAARGNSDNPAALALFLASDPGDDSAPELARAGSFIHVLAQTAVDATRNLGDRTKAALS